VRFKALHVNVYSISLNISRRMTVVAVNPGGADDGPSFFLRDASGTWVSVTSSDIPRKATEVSIDATAVLGTENPSFPKPKPGKKKPEIGFADVIINDGDSLYCLPLQGWKTENSPGRGRQSPLPRIVEIISVHNSGGIVHWRVRLEGVSELQVLPHGEVRARNLPLLLAFCREHILRDGRM
jgi:hypothetical protein